MKLVDAAALYFPEMLRTIDENLFVPRTVVDAWSYMVRNIMYQPINCGWGYFDGMEYKRPYAICNIELAGDKPSVYLQTDYADGCEKTHSSDPAFWFYYYEDRRLRAAFDADPRALLSNNSRFFFWRKAYVDLP